MKTLQEILNTTPVFLHNFTDTDSVLGNFEHTLEGEHILFASYDNANYSGDAFVLYSLNNKLFEVNGSHCSCYGLEGQWKPEEVSLEGLKHRLLNGTLGSDSYIVNEFANELKQFLGISN